MDGDAHTRKQQRAVRARWPGRLLRFVRLSSERARQAVRHDCSSAEKQESPAALLVVVRGERLERRFEPLATGPEQIMAARRALERTDTGVQLDLFEE